MEKDIASHDLSDMMVYKIMDAGSRKFYFKQSFVRLRKVLERGIGLLERGRKQLRQFFESDGSEYYGVHSTAMAVYGIGAASILISFFWFMLLLGAV